MKQNILNEPANDCTIILNKLSRDTTKLCRFDLVKSSDEVSRQKEVSMISRSRKWIDLPDIFCLRRRSILFCLIGFFLFPLLLLTYWQAALTSPYKHASRGMSQIYQTDLQTLYRLLSGANQEIPKGLPCAWCGNKRLTGNGTQCIGPGCVADEVLTLEEIQSTRQTVYSRTGTVDCPSLFFGDENKISLAREYMKTNKRPVLSPSYYIEATKDCSAFRRTRGYFSKPLSKKEEDFPIAYSILMYDSVEQVERLLRAIYMPQNFYCIHVDGKSSPEVQQAIRALANCFNNVVPASRFVPVYWGHMSIIEAEMTCIEDLLRMSNKWKYFINLSGQMFPVHSNAELVDILTLYGGANDVEGSLVRSDYMQFRLRYMFEWYLSPLLERMVITPQLKGKPPLNVTVLKGSNQVALTREFILYFMYHPWSQKLIDWFSNIFIPDEFIWPTLSNTPHLHAPGSFKGNPERKPFTVRGTIWRWYAFQENWSWEYWECRGKWVRDICIFGVGDLPWLNQRPEMFVNKFHAAFEPLAYDCMEEMVFNKTMWPSNFDMSYYEDLPFVRNRSLVTTVEDSLQFIQQMMKSV